MAIAMEQRASRADGTYFLYYYPDCVGGHHGQYEGRSVFAVGMGTELEKLFRSEDLEAAANYANSLEPRLQIIRPSTVELCDQAVLDLYG